MEVNDHVVGYEKKYLNDEITIVQKLLFSIVWLIKNSFAMFFKKSDRLGFGDNVFDRNPCFGNHWQAGIWTKTKKCTGVCYRVKE